MRIPVLDKKLYSQAYVQRSVCFDLHNLISPHSALPLLVLLDAVWIILFSLARPPSLPHIVGEHIPCYGILLSYQKKLISLYKSNTSCVDVSNTVLMFFSIRMILFIIMLLVFLTIKQECVSIGMV